MPNKSVDVLQEYRSKTRKPRSPNPETLHHLVHANNTHDLDVDNGENEDEDEGQGDEPVKKKHAPRSSNDTFLVLCTPFYVLIRLDINSRDHDDIVLAPIFATWHPYPVYPNAPDPPLSTSTLTTAPAKAPSPVTVA